MKSEDEDLVLGSPLSWYDKRKAFVFVVQLGQKCLVGLFRGSCQVSWQFFHKQLDQRKACSVFLSPESLHDRDPQSWLDSSLRPGAPLNWKMILKAVNPCLVDKGSFPGFFVLPGILCHQQSGIEEHDLCNFRNTSFRAQFYFPTTEMLKLFKCRGENNEKQKRDPKVPP